MDRRTFIALAATLGSAFSPPVLQCLARLTDGGGRAAGAWGFEAEQRDTVAALVARIIPATETPGAHEVGVPAFIEFMLAEGFDDDERDRFIADLARVERSSRREFGALYPDLPPDRQDAILRRLEEAAGSAPAGGGSSFFQTLKELTLIGYYTSEAGASEELRFVPVPGRFDPCIPLAEGDRAFFYGTPLDTLI